MKLQIIFLLALSIDITAQYTLPQKIHIGLNFSIDYCYRSLDADEAKYDIVLQARNSLEHPKAGYSAGFTILYPITSVLILDLGLQYSDKGERIPKRELNPPVPDPSIPKYTSFLYHYNYLDIPLKLDYVIYNKKFRMFFISGVSANIFISHTLTTTNEYEDGSIRKNNMQFKYDFKPVNFAFIAGIGADIKLSDKLNLRMEPVFRHSLHSIINTPVKSYLWSLGFNTALHLM